MRHELHLAVRGMLGLLALTSILVVVGWAIDGATGAASAGLGAGIVGANHLVAALSTGWARRLHIRVLAVGYAVFVLRMGAVFAALAVVGNLAWTNRALVASGFVGALAAALVTECIAYARRSYVPRWRLITR